MRVEEVMTRDVATVAPDTPLKDVARVLVELGVSGLPVVDADGQVVGVVSEADVLAKERRPSENGGGLARLRHRGNDAEQSKFTARLAGEAMTSPAITIEPYWTIPSAAQIMLDRAVTGFRSSMTGAWSASSPAPTSSAHSRAPTTRSPARSASRSRCTRRYGSRTGRSTSSSTAARPR